MNRQFLMVPLDQVSVTTSGTRQKLSATALQVSKVIVQGDPGNTGDIYFGDVTVAAGKCIKITKGSSLVLNVDDLTDNEVNSFIDLTEAYVDAANSGDKVNVLYMITEVVKYNI